MRDKAMIPECGLRGLTWAVRCFLAIGHCRWAGLGISLKHVRVGTAERGKREIVKLVARPTIAELNDRLPNRFSVLDNAFQQSIESIDTPAEVAEIDFFPT